MELTFFGIWAWLWFWVKTFIVGGGILILVWERFFPNPALWPIGIGMLAFGALCWVVA